MDPLEDLKGYALPLSPEGRSGIVGAPPWHYAVDYLYIPFETDPEAVRRLIPHPLEPGPDPGLAFAIFGDWLSVWNDDPDMVFTNPERTQYKELLLGVSCQYRGKPGQRCVYIWVDNDFTLMRGWFMGFPKKLGKIYMTRVSGLNPALQPLGAGTRLKAICESHGDRLATGTLRITHQVTPDDIPPPFGRPPYHTVHFPSVEAGESKPALHQLIELQAEDTRFGAVWAGKAELTFHPSEIEEHSALQPRNILDGYYFSFGYTFPGAKVLHTY